MNTDKIKALVNELRKGGTSLEDIWNAFDNAVEEAEQAESWRQEFATVAEDTINKVPSDCWSPFQLAAIATMSALERHPEWTKEQADEYYVCVKESLGMQEKLVSAGPQGAMKLLEQELGKAFGTIFQSGKSEAPKQEKKDCVTLQSGDDEKLQKFLNTLGL